MSENKGLVVISFGTSYKDTCEKTIGAIESDLRTAFPDRTFYRAWTSSFIRKKIAERDGERICSPEEALDVMEAEGITDLLIQPTHMLAGGEFDKILRALEPKMNRFEKVAVGRPLLETAEDIAAFAKILKDIFGGIKESEMVVFMGHGSDGTKLPVYLLLQEALIREGAPNMCVGTVEFEPGIEPVLKAVREQKPEKVYLTPLLVVAGDHALNDMAGDDPDSWKNQIAKEGPDVECIIKGLGEYPQIRKLYIDRAKQAVTE